MKGPLATPLICVPDKAIIENSANVLNFNVMERKGRFELSYRKDHASFVQDGHYEMTV